MIDISWQDLLTKCRSNHPEVFLGKGVFKICSKFTGEHPRRSAISIKLQSNSIEITLWHGCSPINLLHIFRTSCPKNISGGLLLSIQRLSFTHPITVSGIGWVKSWYPESKTSSGYELH